MAGGGARAVSDDLEWALRSEYWANTAAPFPTRKLRERSTHSLILTGHGMALKVEAGTLFIKNGFTHYPQVQETHRFFRGDLSRPARNIVLDGSGHFTFDVLDWLAEQDVPLIRVSWTGEVITVAGGSGFGADREKVAWQRATREDEARRMAFGRDLIARKLEGSAETLEIRLPHTPMRDRALI